MAVWSKTCLVLKRELGDATFGSWLGQAALREFGDEVCVVAATGVARDWIRHNAWRRIGELWAQNDPLGRRLDLKSRMEVDAAPPPPAANAPVAATAPRVAEVFEIEAAEAVAPVAARQGRLQGLQERYSFD
ncbi:MAG TPA: DnaA N-terminal domain-containing protein, partial [Phenylobacterium sp.]|nr:DnaA N-terminal domain-containing protein [Phenylobacterium sp.]